MEKVCREWELTTVDPQERSTWRSGVRSMRALMWMMPLHVHQKSDYDDDDEDQLLLNAGQKYFRKLQGEHFAILLTCIKLPFVIKIFVLSILEWPFYTGFTVLSHKNSFKIKKLWKSNELFQMAALRKYWSSNYTILAANHNSTDQTAQLCRLISSFDMDIEQKQFPLILLDLILYFPSTIFQLNRDGSSWVEPVQS